MAHGSSMSSQRTHPTGSRPTYVSPLEFKRTISFSTGALSTPAARHTMLARSMVMVRQEAGCRSMSCGTASTNYVVRRQLVEKMYDVLFAALGVDVELGLNGRRDFLHGDGLGQEFPDPRADASQPEVGVALGIEHDGIPIHFGPTHLGIARECALELTRQHGRPPPTAGRTHRGSRARSSWHRGHQ